MASKSACTLAAAAGSGVEERGPRAMWEMAMRMKALAVGGPVGEREIFGLVVLVPLVVPLVLECVGVDGWVVTERPPR